MGAGSMEVHQLEESEEQHGEQPAAWQRRPFSVAPAELRTAAVWACIVMALTCFPYFWVWWTTPREGVFPGILFNSDDHGVYFAWMRQARDGRLLFRNLFTTEPQHGVYFHLYFLLLGWLARAPGIEIPLAYHLGRIFFGVTTLLLVYRLGAFFAPDRFTRGCIFWVTALSSGLGWLTWTNYIEGIDRLSVDVWQPEALTFPSLYVNGLFCVSLTLMLGAAVCLLLAEERGAKWAVPAGVCGLLLGNVHSYDVIHLTLVWVAYLVSRWMLAGRFPGRELRLALIAAAAAAPSVAYMAWLYLTEPVFKARADTATMSPYPTAYLLGYGLLAPLAMGGAMLLARRRGDWPEPDRLRSGLPAAWIVGGVLAAYLPFAFQRKMVMGLHLPIGVLAGIAVAELASRRAGSALPGAGKRPSVKAVLTAGGLVCVLAISNGLFMGRDLYLTQPPPGRTSTGIHPAYWLDRDLQAFEWFGKNTPPAAALLTWPTNGVLAPAWSGRAVYAGHWGETPDFAAKIRREAPDFYLGRWSSEERRTFLLGHGITHVLDGPYEREAVEAIRREFPRLPPPRPLSGEPFLKPVYTNGGLVLYEVTGGS